MRASNMKPRTIKKGQKIIVHGTMDRTYRIDRIVKEFGTIWVEYSRIEFPRSHGYGRMTLQLFWRNVNERAITITG